jgi:ribulose-5-phosphate 4-epimerase/fuculose-1-phosphate aldolase
MESEGVVKFSSAWDKAASFPEDRLEAIIKCRNRMFSLGWIGETAEGIGYGNISNRWKGDQFIISGTGTGGLSHVDSSHFTLVTTFDPDDNSLHCRGPVNASAESMTHGMIYREIATANAVIHIHHMQFWRRLLGAVPTTDPDIPYGTPEMAYEISRLVRQADVVTAGIITMGGHEEGILGFGDSLEKAASVLLHYAQLHGIVDQ